MKDPVASTTSGRWVDDTDETQDRTVHWNLEFLDALLRRSTYFSFRWRPFVNGQ